jgi:hypothetical protein
MGGYCLSFNFGHEKGKRNDGSETFNFTRM